MSQKSYDESPSLYLIPTPIGNLEDITLRALKILESVDFLLCEDTRETSKLLNYYKIKKRLVSCHEYNEKSVKDYVISELRSGKTIGLVTDQGTPIVSDPGYIIVNEVISSGYNVIGLPGSTAFVPALISSGITPSPFLFYGFLSQRDVKRKKELESLKLFKYTMIFYEAPHRIEKTLNNMLEVFGDRHISLNREISKIYEEIYRDKISHILPICGTIKGEIVLIVEGNTTDADYSNISILEHVKLYLDDGISEKEAIKKVAQERNVAKSTIYREYMLGRGK